MPCLLQLDQPRRRDLLPFLLGVGLSVQYMMTFLPRVSRAVPSWEGLRAHAKPVHMKKRFCMTAKYVSAHDWALLNSPVREDILSLAGLACDRKSIRELFPRTYDSSFSPLLSGGKEDVWNACWSDPLLWVQAPRAKWRGARYKTFRLTKP